MPDALACPGMMTLATGFPKGFTKHYSIHFWACWKILFFESEIWVGFLVICSYLKWKKKLTTSVVNKVVMFHMVSPQMAPIFQQFSLQIFFDRLSTRLNGCQWFGKLYNLNMWCKHMYVSTSLNIWDVCETHFFHGKLNLFGNVQHTSHQRPIKQTLSQILLYSVLGNFWFVEFLSFFLKEISLPNWSIYLSICFFSKHQTPEVSHRRPCPNRCHPWKNHPLSWETPTLPIHRHEGLVCRYPVLFAPWWCFTTNCANPSEDANHKFRWMKQHKVTKTNGKTNGNKKTGVFYKSTKKNTWDVFCILLLLLLLLHHHMPYSLWTSLSIYGPLSIH